MNSRTLLIVSLVANVALACSVMFLTREFSRLPDATPALVIYKSADSPHAPVDNIPPLAPASPK